MKKMLTVVLLTVACNSFAQTFTETEKLATSIRNKIEQGLKDLEADTSVNDMPHADFDKKRKTLLRESNSAMLDFEKNVKKKIITKLEYYSKSYNSVNESNYEEIEKEAFRKSIYEQAKLNSKELSNLYSQETKKLYSILGFVKSPFAAVSELDTPTSYVQLLKRTPGYVTSDEFSRMRELMIQSFAPGCFTWSCPNLYRLTIAKFLKSIINLEKPIKFKLDSNREIVIDTQNDRAFDEYILSFDLTDPRWINSPFDISVEELKQIEGNFAHTDILGLHTQEFEDQKRNDRIATGEAQRKDILDRIQSRLVQVKRKAHASSCTSDLWSLNDELRSVDMDGDGSRDKRGMTDEEIVSAAKSFAPKEISKHQRDCLLKVNEMERFYR